MRPIMTNMKISVLIMWLIVTIIIFILDFATKGKYRTRPVALIALAIGLILLLIYAFTYIGTL